MTQMSPLRRRMIEDMTIRNLSPTTQRAYVYAVQKFSRYFGRSPDRLEHEAVRGFRHGCLRKPRPVSRWGWLPTPRSMSCAASAMRSTCF